MSEDNKRGESERLARLETKVDLILQNQQAFARLVEKHDDRIKVLENTKASVLAVAATFGALSAFLVEHIKSALLGRP